jgi:hypothetical protein
MYEDVGRQNQTMEWGSASYRVTNRNGSHHDGRFRNLMYEFMQMQLYDQGGAA